MIRQYERLIEIDGLLRGRARQTTVTLAVSLQVSQRTIGNDLRILKNRDAPLKYTKKDGWHYSDPSWRLPTISLSKGELFVLVMGARMLESYSGSAYESQLRSSIKRLSELLPERNWIDLQFLADERVLFRSGANMVNLDPLIWESLLEASRSGFKVWIRYYAASDNKESERIIDPYFLHIYRATNSYVIGYCHLRHAIRWFRIDRIKQLRVLDESFERPEDFNPQTYLDQIFQSEVGNISQQVAIWFDNSTAPFIRERTWHMSQEITENPDGSLILYLKVGGLNELKRWVMGYGQGAKVLEPPELVDLVKKEIKGMSIYYG